MSAFQILINGLRTLPDFEGVKNTLKQGARINAQLEEHKDYGNPGWTPLMTANASSRMEIAKYFIEKGADLSLRDQNGWDILMAACSRGRLELVKECIEKGANVNTHDTDGYTALMAACRGRNLETDGTEQDYVEIVKLLIEHGADIHAQEKRGETALHKACFDLVNPIILVLIEKGANVNAQSKIGDTPLMTTLGEEVNQQQVLTTIKLLIEKGADVDIKETEYGTTAMQLASECKLYEVVNLLKQHSKQKGGCYIATVCYGSYDAPEVITLRQYRDETLSQTILGRLLITVYYKYSPAIATKLKAMPVFNTFVRKSILDTVVKYISERR